MDIYKKLVQLIQEKPGGLPVARNIYKRLEELIQELLDEHIGGRNFFDALDDQIKSATNFEMVLQLVKPLQNEFIASSGEFGEIVLGLYQNGLFGCKGVVTFNGKILTQGKSIVSFQPKDFDLLNKQFVYVDDSYFSGKTVQTVNQYLRQYNSGIKSVHVIYDGSQNSNIKSFYRYY
jgi:hypothetical protein